MRSDRDTLKYLTFAPSTGIRFNWNIIPRVTMFGLVRSSYSRTVITQNQGGYANQRAFWLEHALGVTTRIAGGFRVGLGLNMYNDYESLGAPLVGFSLCTSYAFGEKHGGEL